MVVTGLTKLKMGDTFSEMKNVTLLTSIGLVYRWGKNIQPVESPYATTTKLKKLQGSSSFAEALHTHQNVFKDFATKDPPTPATHAHYKWEFLDNNIDWNAVSAIASKYRRYILTKLLIHLLL